MEFNSSRTEYEKSCREIHGSWNELSRLGAALVRLTRSERWQIKDTYRAMFHDDLVERLHGAHMSNPKNEVYHFVLNKAICNSKNLHYNDKLQMKKNIMYVPIRHRVYYIFLLKT